MRCYHDEQRWMSKLDMSRSNRQLPYSKDTQKKNIIADIAKNLSILSP